MRAVILAILLLAGCGGGGGETGSGIDPRLARLDIYEAQKLRVLGDPGAGVMGMPAASGPDMPASGSATFDGFVTIRVETGPAPTVLAGDAFMTVDFDGGAMSGEMGRFFGTATAGHLINYDGALAVTGGNLGGTTPGAWMADYAGALSGGGATLEFDGILSGAFYGSPLAALAGYDLEALILVNGNETDGALVIVAEGGAN